MIDQLDELFRPIVTVSQFVGRALFWLAWDWGFQTIGWSIGWCVCRVLTFGKFPEVEIGQLDEVSLSFALFIEVIGLLTLAAAVYALMKL